MIPGAEMVKFAKNGSDVTTAALKLARACTGRELVAICGDQPFFSIDDWFIGSTAMPGGIPEVIRRQTLKFRYNDLASLAALFGTYPEQIACVCMEAETTEPPAAGYLQAVIDLCHQHGALFVLDEIITGFRWHTGGAQTLYGITPDLSTFGKGLGNGFAVSALVGKAAIMERGGLMHDKERVFLLSTTHGAETHSLAAAIATMRTYQEHDVIGQMDRQGERLARKVRQAAGELGICDYFEVAGRASNLIFVARDADKNRSQPFRTLFMQEVIRRGVLGPSFVMSYAHSDADIDSTVEAVAAALRVYYRALEDGVGRYLIGRPVKPVFRPRNWLRREGSMKVVLFCGGLGTRLKEFSETIPKPMVEIDHRPIMWHLMKYYAHFGHTEFILCLGFGGDVIRNYFLNYNECLSNDFVLSDGGRTINLLNQDISDWTITFVDTGLNANIGQRLLAVKRFLENDEFFMANYADGLSDLDLSAYIDHYHRHGKIASFLCVQPSQSFHVVALAPDGEVTSIQPVQEADLWINGGYFVFRREIFDYMRPGEELGGRALPAADRTESTGCLPEPGLLGLHGYLQGKAHV